MWEMILKWISEKEEAEV